MFRQILGKAPSAKALVWITPELALGPRAARGPLSPADEGRHRQRARRPQRGVGRRGGACPYGLRFFHVPVEDFEAPSQEQLVAATDWTLAEIAAGRKVYVHCRSGIGRSPCVACAVLMAIGYPLADAYRMVRRERPWATFSETQQAALEEFERRQREQGCPNGLGKPPHRSQTQVATPASAGLPIGRNSQRSHGSMVSWRSSRGFP